MFRVNDFYIFLVIIFIRGKKLSSEGALIDYGYSAKIGDTIGILLEFKSGTAELSFYKNGVLF